VIPIVASLRAERALVSNILYKNHNQHRRAPYFASFKELHVSVGHLVAACGVLLGESPPAAYGHCATCAAAALAAQTSRSALALSRKVLAAHTGAGFASLAVVLGASAAVYWHAAHRASELLAGMARDCGHCSGGMAPE
jgi:hypothetical protein